MSRRYIKFQNFRNIGLINTKDMERMGRRDLNYKDCFENLYINSSLEEKNIGELIIIIGENNVGKSNVLDGISVIEPFEMTGGVERNDVVPFFMEYMGCKPRIVLAYIDDEGQYYDIEYYLHVDKTFRCHASAEFEYKTVPFKRMIYELDLNAIKQEFESKLGAYKWAIHELPDVYKNDYQYRFDYLEKGYDRILSGGGPNFEELERLYSELQEMLDRLVHDYNEYSLNGKTIPVAGKYDLLDYKEKRMKALDFVDLRTIAFKPRETVIEAKEIKNAITEKYRISFIPKIVFYKEKPIRGSALKTTPSEIYDSTFFKSLLKAIGEDSGTIRNIYKMSEETSDSRNVNALKINKKIKEKISSQFNKLFFKAHSGREYDFCITFDKDEISLGIRENGETRLLRDQSTSFRWFFNFFFNFLYANDLRAGDIVLMDEPDIHFEIPAKKELRKLIQDYAKETGITFIATTQSPDFIDVNYLEELRIIKRKKCAEGVEIQNNFSNIGDDDSDTLSEILNAFGAHHRDIITDPDNYVVYVEGITDYNYLTAFKLLREKELEDKGEEKKINIAFLPIGGLGGKPNDQAGEFDAAKDDELKRKKLTQLINLKYKNPVVLVDSDYGGNRFKELYEKELLETEKCAKGKLTILQLKDANDNFRVIEDLFSEKERSLYKLNSANKGVASTLFKRNILEEKEPPDTQTQDNFYCLLAWLEEKLLDISC